MAINLASKFSKYVDDAFARESLLRGATSDKVEFTGVNEVSVYSVDKMEMNDYVKSGTSRYGEIKELGDRVQTFRIERDRSFTGSIDEGNAQDQYNVKDASARLHVQVRDVVIPETEAYVMMKWAYGAGKVVGGTAPTADTLLGLIQAGASHMNNCHVPRAGRGMFIAETYAAMLPNLANLTYLEKLGSQALTENSLPRVAGFDVHVVPDADMPAGVYFILQHKDACPFAQKLTKYKIQKDPMGIDGNVIEGRVRYWAGVLGEKCDGVYVYAASDSVQAAPHRRLRHRHRRERYHLRHHGRHRPEVQQHPLPRELRRLRHPRGWPDPPRLRLHRHEVPLRCRREGLFRLIRKGPGLRPGPPLFPE